MNVIKEVAITVPKDLIRNWNGLSLDVGTTVFKGIYLHRDDWEESKVQKEDDSNVKLRLNICRQEAYQDALRVIRDNGHITRCGDAPPVIYTCGSSARNYHDSINETLLIRMNNLNEFVCNIKAFQYWLNNLPLREFLDFVDEDNADYYRTAQEEIKRLMAVLETGKSKIDWQNVIPIRRPSLPLDVPMSESVPDLYPCLVYAISSTTYGHVVDKDGHFTAQVSFSNGGGGTFLGLGALLCGESKTYDQLIDLAEKGDYTKVDMNVFDIVKHAGGKPQGAQLYSDIINPGEQNVSSSYSESIVMFGKCIYQDGSAFKKEDLIQALLYFLLKPITSDLFQTMLNSGTKHAFMIGSFYSRPYVRMVIQTLFYRRQIQAGYMLNGKGLDYQLHFVKNGSHLGAMGALLHSLEQKSARIV